MHCNLTSLFKFKDNRKLLVGLNTPDFCSKGALVTLGSVGSEKKKPFVGHVTCAPSEDRDQTGQLPSLICPVWSESSLSTWTNLGSLASHWAHSKDHDQIAWSTHACWCESSLSAKVIVLVLSCFWFFCQLVVWYMIHVMRKPVFRVSDQVRLKPACSATETS